MASKKLEKQITVHHDMNWDWPLQSDLEGNAKVIEDDDHFEVGLDAQFFTPNEIEVKAIGDLIEIHLEHEDRGDVAGGQVRRSIMRCYHMPEGTDPKTLKSNLDKNGVLHITAKKRH